MNEYVKVKTVNNGVKSLKVNNRNDAWEREYDCVFYRYNNPCEGNDIEKMLKDIDKELEEHDKI